MFASSSSVIALALQDEFDAQRARELESEFDTLSQTERMELVIDMTKVQFIDSCGIGAIVFLYKRLKAEVVVYVYLMLTVNLES